MVATGKERAQGAPVLEAKQRRSRETLERILQAAEELLQERDFDQLTMAELAERAGCGVGTVYGRIPNKESLVACLYERQGVEAQRITEAYFDRCRDADLEESARQICSVIVEHCASRRGTIRATTAHLFRRPGGDVYGFRRQITAAFQEIVDFLAGKAKGIHSSPRQACAFALLAVTDVAQSRIVFGDRSGIQLRYSKKALKERLTSLLLAYLQSSPRGRE